MSIYFDKSTTFQELAGLDRRISKAISHLGFVYPTAVQAKCIPLALEGRDVLARAKTGSGKTVAYGVPIIQNLLTFMEAFMDGGNQGEVGAYCVILVPTRELVAQVYKQMQQLLYYCNDVVTMLALSGDMPHTVQATQLQEKPNIIVATPTRLLHHLEQGNVNLKVSLQMLVMDEADLVLSYGYEDDVNSLLSHLPKLYQSMLMSATLTPQLDALKSVVLHDPVTITTDDNLMQDKNKGERLLKEFYIECKGNDKQLLLYTLLTLNLIKGKTLFFVNSVDSAFRAKLFLEQFSIKAAVLNAELPFNSRSHIIQQFNRGLIDYLIATDESFDEDEAKENEEEEEEEEEEEMEEEEEEDEDEDEDEDLEAALMGKAINESGDEDEDEDEDEDDDEDDDEEGDEEDDDDNANMDKAGLKKLGDNVFIFSSSTPLPSDEKSAKGKKKTQNNGKKGKKDNEFGVSRGIDFQDVATVVNIDFPNSVKAYTHRVGRTARGGKTGTALSLVSEDNYHENKGLESVLDFQLQRAEEEVDRKGVLEDTSMAAPSASLKRLNFNMKDVESFRYRVADVSRAVTKAAVKEARLKEIKNEMLHSVKLKAHFEDNPRELDLLKHDKALRPSKVQRHLSAIPSYLVPTSLKGKGFMPGLKQGLKKKKNRKRARKKNQRGGNNGGRGDKNDNPLTTFEFNQQLTTLGRKGGKAPASGVLSDNRVSYRGSTAGRRKWKERHGKDEKPRKKRRKSRGKK